MRRPPVTKETLLPKIEVRNNGSWQGQSPALALYSIPPKNSERKNSAFLVLTEDIHSGNARNQESAPKTGVAALITLYSTDPQKSPGDAKNSQSSKITKVSRRQSCSESSGMPSVTVVKGLLQVTEVELTSLSSSAKVLA